MAPVVKLRGPVVSVSVVAGDGGTGADSQAARQGQRELEAEKASLARAAGALATAAARLEAICDNLPARIESHLVELATGIARKVLCQELQAGRYEIEAVVREATAGLENRNDVAVHLNPEDLRRSGLAVSADGQGGAVRYVPDERVGLGECLVETGDGVVELTVESQLAQIEEALKASVAN